MEHIQGKVGHPGEAAKICGTPLIFWLLIGEIGGNITWLKEKFKSQLYETTEISEIFSFANQRALLQKDIYV